MFTEMRDYSLLILARLKLVKTKGYGVRATTIEGQIRFCSNAVLFASFTSKHAWSDYNRGEGPNCAWSRFRSVHSIILNGSPHTCRACVIETWRLGLRVPLVARNKDRRLNQFSRPKFIWVGLNSNSIRLMWTRASKAGLTIILSSKRIGGTV